MGVVAALCAALAAGAITLAERHARAREDARFAAAVSATCQRVSERLQDTVQSLESVRSLFAASERVDRSEWAAYCASLGLPDGYPPVRAVAWIRRVPWENEPGFLQPEPQPGREDVSVGSADPRHPGPRCVVEYVEPLRDNADILGFDVASVPALRDALDAARDADEVRASGARRGLSGAGDDWCVVAYLPVFRNGAPHESVAERRAACTGWVAAVVGIASVVDASPSAASAGIDVELFDGTRPGEDALIYDGDGHLGGSRETAADPSVYASRSHVTETAVAFGGRQWTLRASTLPVFDAATERGGIWLAGTVSILAGGLLTGFTWSLVTRRSRAIGLANAMSRALRRSEELHRRVVETATDAVVAFDGSGRVRGWNAAATSLLGWTADEALGRDVGDVLLPPRASGSEQPGSLVPDGVDGEGELVETVARRRDGCEIPVERSLAIAETDDGPLFTVFVRDVSERREQQQRLRDYVRQIESSHEEIASQAARLASQTRELAAARDAADAANLAKSEFLATMSHEIRTPLNGVVGTASLLARTALTPVQRDLVQTIESSAEALLAVIGDILDFSRIEAGGLELECQPFDVRDACEQVLDILWARAAERRVELAVRCRPAHPLRVVGDAVRFRQIVLNLVGNAVKFSEDAPVEIEVTQAVAAGRATVLVSVIDHGIGIPAEKAHLLFRRFSQADSSTTRRFGGTGLGLAISKRLVDLMDGEIGLRSTEGEGSTFWFRVALPVAQEPPDAADPRPFVGRGALVAGPATASGQALRDTLEGWGMLVDDVDGAVACLDVLRGGAAPPDIVLLQLERQEADDGVETARALVEALPGSRPAVLVITSSAAEDESRAADLGPRVRVLRRPVRRAALREALAHALGIRAAPTRTASRTPEGPLRAGLCVLVAEDNAVNRRVAEQALVRLGCEVHMAPDGARAAALAATHRYDVILMDCHMPRMDGFEATRTIRAAEMGAARVPIVAMTAATSPDDRAACLAAGMDDYLAKPVRIEALREMIARWSDVSQGAQAR